MAFTELEFEKPIIALEKKIEEMKEYEENLDIKEEIQKLEINKYQFCGKCALQKTERLFGGG